MSIFQGLLNFISVNDPLLPHSESQSWSPPPEGLSFVVRVTHYVEDARPEGEREEAKSSSSPPAINKYKYKANKNVNWD